MRLIKHSDRVFAAEHFLTPGECEQLIALAEAEGFSAAGVRTVGGPQSMPMIRNNERAQLASASWVALIWQKLLALDLPVIDGQHAAGLPKDLRFYKYAVGQRFKMHKDGPWTENGMASKLTLLVYLNEQFKGGATDFRDFIVEPKTGALLLFVHDTWHEGAQVSEGLKYVLRSDVLYSAPPREA